MIKYVRKTTATLTVGTETLYNVLAGASGKNRKVTGISTDPLAAMYLRVYKNAEQIVDASSVICTTASPILPMDLPLNEGDQLSIGFYNDAAATTAKQITVQYTET